MFVPNPPVTASDLFQLEAKITDGLARLQIECCLAGGLAVSVWGEPRTTYDVDLVVAPPKGGADALVELLANDPLLGLAPDRFELTGQVTIVRIPIVISPNSVHPEVVLVDLLLLPGQLTESILRRAVSIEIEGKMRKISTAEDLILIKLLSAREKDREDIRNLVRLQRESLNFAYIDEWAKLLGVGMDWKSL